MHSTQINLVAVDFDMTMVDVHTGGRWQSGEAELAQRIRPFFRAFIPKAAEHGLHVAVVTFSEQVNDLCNCSKKVLAIMTIRTRV
jgi:hypothetical protein